MLYAELHEKLGSNASDSERSEDILTSTTFGTLLVAGATDVLIRWLNCARHLDTAGSLDQTRLKGVAERAARRASQSARRGWGRSEVRQACDESLGEVASRRRKEAWR
jgi:hypothetical protein